MKKDKEKEKQKFNSADYEYLNEDIPLLGWAWEFERRSEAYRKAYREFSSLDLNEQFLEDPSVKELFFLEPFNWDPNKTWPEVSEGIKALHVNKSEPVRVFNLKWKDVKINSEQAKVKRRSGKNSITFSYVRGYTGHPFAELYKEMGREDIVMALITLSRPNKKIIEDLERVIEKWRKLLKINVVQTPTVTKEKENKILKDAPHWAECLLIYDFIISNYDSFLREKTLSFKKVQSELGWISEDTIGSRYKTAKEMIEGGYKSLF